MLCRKCVGCHRLGFHLVQAFFADHFAGLVELIGAHEVSDRYGSHYEGDSQE